MQAPIFYLLFLICIVCIGSITAESNYHSMAKMSYSSSNAADVDYDYGVDIILKGRYGNQLLRKRMNPASDQNCLCSSEEVEACRSSFLQSILNAAKLHPTNGVKRFLALHRYKREKEREEGGYGNQPLQKRMNSNINWLRRQGSAIEMKRSTDETHRNKRRKVYSKRSIDCKRPFSKCICDGGNSIVVESGLKV